MESEEENAHTFTSLGWTARLLVKKLKKPPERLAEAEAPASKSREETPQTRPPRAEGKRAKL
jgi:hypothetical protein